jgi:hypothetical protein
MAELPSLLHDLYLRIWCTIGDRRLRLICTESSSRFAITFSAGASTFAAAGPSAIDNPPHCSEIRRELCPARACSMHNIHFWSPSQACRYTTFDAAQKSHQWYARAIDEPTSSLDATEMATSHFISLGSRHTSAILVTSETEEDTKLVGQVAA